MLNESLAGWILADHMRFHKLKRVSKAERRVLRERAERILATATANRTLKTLVRGGKPLVVVAQTPSRQPRVKNQQVLHVFYDRSASVAWLRKNLGLAARQAPAYTSINLSPEQDKAFRKTLERAGFKTRYEILRGDTKTALKQLVQERHPPRDLKHLGLEMRPVTKPEELDACMRLQKRVALASKTHGYFSHSKDQLKQDRLEYEQILAKKNGLMLGVFKGKRLLGLMITGIHDDDSHAKRHGGFSFFLDPSIQGKGITKTGYLILLEFLNQNKVRKFFGGTSQPAIQSLGRLMKRETEFVIYVKM